MGSQISTKQDKKSGKQATATSGADEISASTSAKKESTAASQNEPPKEPGRMSTEPTMTAEPQAISIDVEATNTEKATMNNEPATTGTEPGTAIAVKTLETIETAAVVEDTSANIEHLIKKWIGFREIFVQYIPGKPYALTEFGALLFTQNGHHEFRQLDATGLARSVGLRSGDVLLSINNPSMILQNVDQRAILESFNDIGTNICLVIKRSGTEIWLFAFHLGEKYNRPFVEAKFEYRIDASPVEYIFPLRYLPTIPDEAAFCVNGVYTYENSATVQMILSEKDRYMEIDTDKATYVLHTQTVVINQYREISGVQIPGTPVTISTPSPVHSALTRSNESVIVECNSPMCLEVLQPGPLSVVVFPSYMTQPDTQIPQNDMFFFATQDPEGTKFQSANPCGGEQLYISEDVVEGGDVWLGSAQTTPSFFAIEQNGKRVDFLDLFSNKNV